MGDGKFPEFEEAYVAHKDRLLTLAAALTGDRSAAEDVVHDVFSALIGEPRRLRNGSNLPGFLTVCARNRAFDLLRKSERRNLLRERKIKHSVDASMDDPGLLVAQDEEEEVLLQTVAALPGELREVIALRIWGELSFEEIGGLQKTTKSTAHTRYRQALEKLRTKLVKGGSND